MTYQHQTTDETLLTADVPEKFIDQQTGQVRMSDFAKSYRALEKQFAQRPTSPKAPHDYKIDCAHGMFTPDADVNARMHQMGFTQDQAQEVYNMAAEKMMPMIAQIAADYEADRQVEKLINHFGGAEQWKAVSRQLLTYGQKTMPADVLANMTSSFEGVMALHRLMMSDEPGIATDAQDGLSAMAGEQDLQAMMRDPRYWRDRDPAYVQKVTDGFKAQYSS